MKKYFILIFIALLSLSSCGKVNNFKTQTGVLNKTGLLTKTGSSKFFIKNPINKKFEEFVKLDKEEIKNYNCSEITNSTDEFSKNLIKSCEARKIIIQFKGLNENEIINYNCDGIYKNNSDIEICQKSKVGSYIELLKSKNIKTYNCTKTFTDKVEIGICNNFSKMLIN